MKYFEDELKQSLILAFFGTMFGGQQTSKFTFQEAKEVANKMYLTEPKFCKMINAVHKNIMDMAKSMKDRELEKSEREVKELKRIMSMN